MTTTKENEEQVSSSRRQFLRGVAAVSAVGLAASAGTAVADTPALTVEQEKPEQGYHETDHIRSYYASCR
ncbi:hypothetical protein [Nitrincola schmidtii]|uniref:hypothetical protein n=1 Tax=Nitrincola schmidtii TaxID=1730894 RepID=UPI00124DD03E|nr:hypothetical protein [Nitrincola schmidtii]